MMEFLFVSFHSVSIHLLVSFRVFTQAEIYAPRRATAFFFSVAQDQMLVAWGNRAPLEHSLDGSLADINQVNL